MELWITILPETRVITFPYGGKMRTVRTRVMEEYETEDGELEEVSKNFVADCNPMNDVYYFGEDVFDGDGNPLPDAWLAGGTAPRPAYSCRIAHTCSVRVTSRNSRPMRKIASSTRRWALKSTYRRAHSRIASR